MSNPLRTPEDYELFLYRLMEQFPLIHRSTVTFIRRGSSLARVAGELHFDHDGHDPRFGHSTLIRTQMNADKR